ncbi:MAG: sodium:solute symporter [Kiritimatiellales bacterium]
MTIGFIDLSIIIIYCAAMAYMGFHFSKKNTSTEEYFLGGRSFPGWAIGVSMIGTSISSVTFIAYPADAFKTTWVRFVPALAYPLAAILAVKVFIPFFRNNNVTSAYEYIEARFSAGLRVYSASVSLLGQIFRISIILYLLALLMHELTGIGLSWCVLFSGAVVSIYTIVGGIDAVVWTDVIQTVILFLGGIICIALVAVQLPGGFGEILSVGIEHHKFSFADIKDGMIIPAKWGFSLSEKTVTMLFLMGFIGWINGHTADQNMVQRYCASKSEKDAKHAVWIACLSSIPVWAFYMFLGTALYVFFSRFPTTTASEILSGVQKAEQIVPYFIMNYLPIGIRGLVIVSALAAAMSSLDSSINAIATISVVDIYRRHLVKNKTDQHYLRVAKIVACIASILMLLGALILIRTTTTTIRDMLMLIGSVMTSGILGLYLLGFFTRRATARAAVIGIILSTIFTIFMLLHSRDIFGGACRFSFEMYYVGVIGNLLMMIVGYFLSLIPFCRKEKDLTGLTVWTQEK